MIVTKKYKTIPLDIPSDSDNEDGIDEQASTSKRTKQVNVFKILSDQEIII